MMQYQLGPYSLVKGLARPKCNDYSTLMPTLSRCTDHPSYRFSCLGDALLSSHSYNDEVEVTFKRHVVSLIVEYRSQ